MKFGFPVKNVLLTQADAVPAVAGPFTAGDGWQSGSTEFALQVPGVGEFYAMKVWKLSIQLKREQTPIG